MNIYIHKNDEQFGPFNDEQLSDGMKTGQFTLDDLAWHEGQTEWVPLSSLWQPSRPPHNIQQTSSMGNAQVLQTNVKQGAVIGGWLCFAIGLATMYFSMWTFFIYGPLFLVAFILSIIAMAQKRIIGGIALLLTTIILPSILGIYFFTTRTTEFVSKALVGEVKTTVNLTKSNEKLDEKNGFRNFKLGSPFSEYESVVVKTSKFMTSNTDEQSFHVKNKEEKIGNTAVEYIALDFNQNILTEIRVGVEGKENIWGLKESLIAAFGEPSEIKNFKADETLIWVGKETRLEFNTSSMFMLGGSILGLAKYTNPSVKSKVEEIIKRKAKDNADEGAKSL